MLHFQRYYGPETSVVVIFVVSFILNFFMNPLLLIVIFNININITIHLFNLFSYIKISIKMYLKNYKGMIAQIIFVKPCRIIIIHIQVYHS